MVCNDLSLHQDLTTSVSPRIRAVRLFKKVCSADSSDQSYVEGSSTRLLSHAYQFTMLLNNLHYTTIYINTTRTID